MDHRIVPLLAALAIAAIPAGTVRLTAGERGALTLPWPRTGGTAEVPGLRVTISGDAYRTGSWVVLRFAATGAEIAAFTPYGPPGEDKIWHYDVPLRDEWLDAARKVGKLKLKVEADLPSSAKRETVTVEVAAFP